MRRTATSIALRGVGFALAGLFAINGAVRLTGGSPWWLSPRHLETKITALSKLARHAPGHLFEREPGDLSILVSERARHHGVPADLVLKIARAESSLGPHCISHAGAMGVMQLMPATARELGVDDPFDPRQNIDGGVRYLARLWRRYAGDRVRVVAAYNAGPGRVPRRGRLVLPAETRIYLGRVLR